MDDTAIHIENISKTFKLPHEKNNSLKSAVINFYKRDKGFERQKALNKISFDVKKGEFFGVVGRNGSGKSTLLKILAGIYSPDTGNVAVNGKLIPFIELGVGFSPELSGRDNVFLNGSLLGFSRKEMKEMYEDIVDFAEIRKFMDQKLKNYSSGMQVRLAFSIAIRAKSDILLLDEVLAVGDLDFQQKCYNYFNELKNQSKTIIFVTHDMSAVRRFCNKAIIIDGGQILKVGAPDDIARLYEKINLQSAGDRLNEENQESKTVKNKDREGNSWAVIEKVETFDTKTKKSSSLFLEGNDIGIRIFFKAKRHVDNPSLGYIFQDDQNRTVFATNNKVMNVKTKPLNEGDEIVIESQVKNIFTNGQYTITCAIESEDFSVIYDRREYVHKFLVGGHQLAHAITHPEHTFKVDTRQSNKS